jgi:outer membrane protein
VNNPSQSLKFLILFCLGMILLFPTIVPAAQEKDIGLTLKDCLKTALTKNPLAIEAGLAVKSAEETVTSAQGRHWPRLTLDGSYTRREQPFPYIQAQAVNIPPHFSDTFSSLGLTLTLPLYQGGQVSNGVALAKVRRDVQELAAGQTKNDIIANTVNAYNKILQLQTLQKASSAQVQALEEQTKNTKLLLEVGRVPRVDLLKVEVQLANEQQRLLAIEEGLKNASATLWVLMGNSSETLTVLPLLLDRLAAIDYTVDFTSGLAIAHDRRPEYLSAHKAVEEAKLNQKLALGRLLPTLNLFASDTRWTGYTPNYNDTIWVAGLTLSIPLFDRTSYADLSREKVQVERASQRLLAAENQLGLEVSTSITSTNESRNRVHTAEKAVVQGEESFRVEQQKYESGAGAMVDLLLAQSASINAIANYTQALFDYNAALVAYHKATGTLEEYLQ